MEIKEFVGKLRYSRGDGREIRLFENANFTMGYCYILQLNDFIIQISDSVCYEYRDDCFIDQCRVISKLGIHFVHTEDIQDCTTARRTK